MRRGGNVAVAADLGATPDQSMRIDHRAFTNVSTDVHEHRRHANHAAADVTTIANAGATGNDAHTVGSRERTHRVGGLVKERLLRGVDRHISDGAHSKAKQDSLFHPGVRAPAGFRRGIRFGSANFAAIQRGFEIAEEPEMFFLVVSWSFVKQTLNLRRQHEPSRPWARPPGG